MAVFRHGGLRLYLLKLLDDGPKHGYELIRLLESRFRGRYAPSAGTIYPRLRRLEADGQVTRTAAGGRKVYTLTEAGRAELRDRSLELAALESDILARVQDLAGREPDGLEPDGREPDGRGSRRTPRDGRRAGPPPRPASPEATAVLDRCLADFTAQVRGLLRDARLDGADANTVAEALETSLDGAVHTLRRLLP
jgi:DNA-binding PadR family transcriptional regulator